MGVITFVGVITFEGVTRVPTSFDALLLFLTLFSNLFMFWGCIFVFYMSSLVYWRQVPPPPKQIMGGGKVTKNEENEKKKQTHDRLRCQTKDCTCQ